MPVCAHPNMKLRRILRAVEPTLNTLSLTLIFLTLGSLYHVLQELKGYALVTSLLNIRAPWLVNDDWNVYGHDCTEALIKEFACGGRGWSNYLLEYLSWEF